MAFSSRVGIRLLAWVVFGGAGVNLAAGEAVTSSSKELLKKKRVFQTARIGDAPPAIDGSVDDSVWDGVEWAGDFIQREPAEGVPPTFQTQFKVVYDDDALYFAFRMFDDPEKVSSLMDRRDNFPGDWIEVNIDSYQDRRTAFSFTLSLSGTRGDEFISNDGNNWDSSWDPIWKGATRVTEEGWTAEARIPLSQLRFSGDDQQTWGLQVQRRLFRLEERSTWQFISKDSSGWVSQFGELRGLKKLKPKRRIELLPYGVGGGRRADADPNDPFFDGGEGIFEAGLDGKLGITNNLTIDFTVNPDFGQVEADPSQVNLTSFETFFQEKRPFFIEGRDILNLPVSPAATGGSFTSDRLFYSRRIGRPPGFRPRGDFVDQPDRTTILGAFKLTGKTKRGLSLGILESVTDEESARVINGDLQSKETVEPLSNYLVGRVQKDFRNGDTQIGGMFTAVNRSIEDPHLEGLPSEATAGGVDFSTYLNNRDYFFEARLLGSRLRGSEQAMLNAQTSSARYYQRPDNDNADLDPNRRELDGHAASVRFSRTNNHALRFETGAVYRSPGFEINDLGFMRNADQLNQFLWVGYQKRNPFSIFDSLWLNFNEWADWDSGGHWLGSRFNVNGNATFRNKMWAYLSMTRTNDFASNTELRGGPSSLWPGSTEYSFNGNTDPRRKIFLSLGGSLERGDSDSGDTRNAWFQVNFRPTNAIRLSINPSRTINRPEMQYVTTARLGEEDRYLFGRLDQETTSLTLRVNWALTPNLTFELYASPFVSRGRYDDFKRIISPRADRYRDRFQEFTDASIRQDGNRFQIDEDGNGEVDYGFRNPDFDFRDFNSNMVIRWEYMPGSTVFLVWSQARGSVDHFPGESSFSDDINRLFSAHPENVVLLKISKWFHP